MFQSSNPDLPHSDQVIYQLDHLNTKCKMANTLTVNKISIFEISTDLYSKYIKQY